MELTIGNTTTIATWIGGLILPYLSMYQITQDQLTSIITGIIILTWLMLNSKYPNTFEMLGNNETTITNDDPNKPLNDEYEC